MRRKRKGLLGILLTSPFSLGALTITYGPIKVSKIVGDPLIANKSQSLTFTISHQGGDYRNIFDFVFSVSDSSNATLFKTKKSYYKVPNGEYEVSTTIPASVLKQDAVLTFSISCERTYSSGNYVCYSSRQMKQIPLEEDRLFTSDAETRYFGIESVYYPSVEFGRNAFYTFYNVQKKRDSNSRRFRLEDIYFDCNYVSSDYTPVNSDLGELRIYTNINYWRIGTIKKKRFVSLPLTYKYSNGVYSLQLGKSYSFSRETGEMMEPKSGYPMTRDLILPYWATESSPLKISVALLDFNAAKESYVFTKEAYYDGDGPLGDYSVKWEEK